MTNIKNNVETLEAEFKDIELSASTGYKADTTYGDGMHDAAILIKKFHEELSKAHYNGEVFEKVYGELKEVLEGNFILSMRAQDANDYGEAEYRDGYMEILNRGVGAVETYRRSMDSIN